MQGVGRVTRVDREASRDLLFGGGGGPGAPFVVYSDRVACITGSFLASDRSSFDKIPTEM